MSGPRLRCLDGTVVALALERWLGPPTPEESQLLDRGLAPVLDVGCGPGRHVLALGLRGMAALGIDISPHAVRLALARGATVLERSVFDPLPGTGRWGTVLLLDGNIGIGGNPEALLHRSAELLRPGGRLLVEVEPPRSATRSLVVRLEMEGEAGPWFPWAQVGADALDPLARQSGFGMEDLWTAGARWFASLEAR